MYTFWNHLLIWILPLTLGCGLRFLFRKRKKAWLVTTVGILFAIIAYIMNIAQPGFELFVIGIMQGLCFAAASAVTAFLLRPSRQ